MKGKILEEMIKQYMSLRFPVSVFSWQVENLLFVASRFFQDIGRLQITIVRICPNSKLPYIWRKNHTGLLLF